MMYKGDWLIDPDGRACEDRKNGPVMSYTLTPEEIEKMLKGENKMTEANANYEVMELSKDPVKEPEKKRMTKKVVREMAANGKSVDEIVACFDDGYQRTTLVKAKVIQYLKPDEPKVEPVEDPIEFISAEGQTYDFWDGVRHELWGMKESEIDKINEAFEKVLARWVGGDHSEETTAALMFYGEKVLSV